MKTGLTRLWSEQLLLRGFSPRTATAARPFAPFLRNLSTPATRQRGLLLLRNQRSTLPRNPKNIRLKSDKTPTQDLNPTPHLGSPEPAPSLSQRLKKLSREYGWTAVGVYFALSLLDFPFCFLAVRLLGTDRIGHYEDVVKGAFWNVVQMVFPDAGKSSQNEGASEIVAATAREGDLSASDIAIRDRADASIWTQLGLAYLVHKSFIFVRVPLTAAVLPKVVKTLRKWGYDIGKKKPKTPTPKST